MSKHSIKILGHRGHGGYLENTLPAFEESLKYADGFEFDVQLTGDGVPVIIHDETVDRTTNGQGRVDSYTLEELQKLRILDDTGKPLPDVAVPTLEAVLDLAETYIKTRPEIVINIEIKDVRSTAKVVEMVTQRVEHKAWQYTNVIVSCFEHVALSGTKKLNPLIPLGVLYEDKQEATLHDVIKVLDPYAVHPSIADLKSKVFNPANSKKPLVLWIDGEEGYPGNMTRIKDALNVNPSIVITNHPKEVKRELQKMGRTSNNTLGMIL